MREDWIECKLGEILTVSSGKGLSASKMEAGKFPVYGGNGISGYHSHFLFEDIKLIIGRVGAKCGVVHITQSNSWVTDNALVVNFKFETPILKFFKLLLEIENLNKLSNSTAQPVISGAKIYEYDILFPPLPEQRAIVKKLESLFSSLDAGVADLKKAQQQLKIYRQAVLKKAFEGKLTNKVIKDDLPKRWKIVKIIDLVDKDKNALKAGPFGSSLKKEFYTNDGYKIYGQEQVIKSNPYYGDYYVDEQKYNELYSCRVRPNDILISLVGTVGKVLLLPNDCLPGIINPRLVKITLDLKKYLPLFFKYYFESAFVRSFYSGETRGTTMDVLNLGIIKTIPFPLPHPDEQKEIVKQIESRLSVCDSIEQNIKESLIKAEALRQSLLKKAFEGDLLSAQELADCKHVADYEPASVLLQRIRNEELKIRNYA